MEHDDDEEDGRVTAIKDAAMRLSAGDASAFEDMVEAYVALTLDREKVRVYCEAFVRVFVNLDTSPEAEAALAIAEKAMILEGVGEHEPQTHAFLLELAAEWQENRRPARSKLRAVKAALRAEGLDSVAALMRTKTRNERFLTLTQEARKAIEAGAERGNLMLLALGALRAIPEKTRSREAAAALFDSLAQLDVRARALEAHKRLAGVFSPGRSRAAKALHWFLVVAARLVLAVEEGRPADELREILAEALERIPEGPSRVTAAAILEDVTTATTPIGRT